MIIQSSMDLQRVTFDNIEEVTAFATEGYTVIPCCQDSLKGVLGCIYRNLCAFYEYSDAIYEFVYYTGQVAFVDLNEEQFRELGYYTRKEIIEYLEEYILGKLIS